MGWSYPHQIFWWVPPELTSERCPSNLGKLPFSPVLSKGMEVAGMIIHSCGSFPHSPSISGYCGLLIVVMDHYHMHSLTIHSYYGLLVVMDHSPIPPLLIVIMD